MSTRMHWLRPIDKRITACGRNAFHSDIFEGSAAEYLGVSNFCVKCERAAQKEHGSGKPKILPAQQWPEPRPIEEAPKDRRILGWEPFLSQGGWWIIAEWDESEEQWVDHDGEFCELTHFLPLPPKLEVRK